VIFTDPCDGREPEVCGLFEETLPGISIYSVSSMAPFSSVRATDAYRTAITVDFSHRTSTSH